RVIRGGQPVRQGGAGRHLVLELRLPAVEELGLDDSLLAGDLQLTLVAQLPHRAELVVALPRQPGEERGVAPELFALPVGGRVVVALGTFQPDAEELPGRAGGQGLWLDVLGREVGGGGWLTLGGHHGAAQLAAGVSGERRRQNTAGDPVIAGVLG